MTAYYNEYDPKAAAWLRELIKQGHIADGVVDERSIEDVTPNELTGFTQCHFFAGIGVWSYALRRAGWADDRAIWTGSCPCQPFSAAGKGAGFADERHLWPAFHHLISQCRPDVVLGEQVASKDGLGWLDLVCADLEAANYAAGAVDLCAAGVGAPHIRQRLWWVGSRLGNAPGGREWAGLADHGRSGRDQGADRTAGIAGGVADIGRELQAPDWGQPGEGGQQMGAKVRDNGRSRFGGMADASGQHLRGELGGGDGEAGAPQGETRQRERRGNDHSSSSADGGMADADSDGRSAGKRDNQAARHGHPSSAEGNNGGVADTGRPSPTNGFWGSADWLFCRDGKWRPVEPGTFPLAHGAAERVGRLRGYGNAINAEAAQAFIESVMETMK